MSLRTSLRTTQIAYRGFSTYLPRWQEPQPQAGPSTPAPVPESTTPKPPTAGGFGALKNILGNADSSSSTSSSDFLSANTVSLASVKGGNGEIRGYSPAALPPKVDPVMDLFTNMIMKDGLKGQAQQKMVNILRHLRETTNQSPVPLLHRAILLASPSIRVLNMRKSMKSVPTPRALSERQRTHQAIAWILKAAEKGRRAGARRDERIAREILAILEGTSEVFKWLETRHKDATLARSNIFAR